MTNARLLPTVEEALQQSVDAFSTCESSPDREASYLLSAVLGQTRAWIMAHPEVVLTAEQTRRWQSWLQQRAEGMPLAYLTGVREFWSLPLQVTSDTLIPRTETEGLVEVAIAHLDPRKTAHILDLGTGSGAVACAIASESPLWQVVATDASAAALKIAKRNALRLGLQDRITCLQGDWLEALKQLPSPRTFDVIVSNPPYVDEQDDCLTQGGVQFEPWQALVAGNQGLAAFEHIIAKAGEFIQPGGWICFEHGAAQAPAVTQSLLTVEWQSVVTHQDLAGHPRITEAKWEQQNVQS